MKRQISTCIMVTAALIFLTAFDVSADCRGCCLKRGGVVCRNGITKCADGTALSAACQARGCNKCSGVNYRFSYPESYKEDTQPKPSKTIEIEPSEYTEIEPSNSSGTNSSDPADIINECHCDGIILLTDQKCPCEQ